MSSDLRADVIEFLQTAEKPHSSTRIAQFVLGLDGRTSLNVNRVLLDLEREGMAVRHENRPVTWSLVDTSSVSSVNTPQVSSVNTPQAKLPDASIAGTPQAKL